MFMSPLMARITFWIWIAGTVLLLIVLPIWHGSFLPVREDRVPLSVFVLVLYFAYFAGIPGWWLFLRQQAVDEQAKILSALKASTLSVEAEVENGLVRLKWERSGEYAMDVLGYRCKSRAPHSPEDAAKEGVLIVNSSELKGKYSDHEAERGKTAHYSFHLTRKFTHSSGLFLEKKSLWTIFAGHVIRSVWLPRRPSVFAKKRAELDLMKLNGALTEAKQVAMSDAERLEANVETILQRAQTQQEAMRELLALQDAYREEIKANEGLSEDQKTELLDDLDARFEAAITNL
jgi:hypothetical protein